MLEKKDESRKDNEYITYISYFLVPQGKPTEQDVYSQESMVYCWWWMIA
jgi:hypothetical protein